MDITKLVQSDSIHSEKVNFSFLSLAERGQECQVQFNITDFYY